MLDQSLTAFVALVTERRLLLIFDGHLTRVSIKVIEKAIELENITIVKLPPHVTRRQVTTAGCGMFWSAQETVAPPGFYFGGGQINNLLLI